MTEVTNLTTLTVFRFIREYRKKNKGLSPSQREIAKGTFIATTTMLNHLSKLEAYGWITREFNIPRSIRIGDNAPDEEVFARLWQAAQATEEEQG